MQKDAPELLRKLSLMMRISAFLWIVIGILQIVLGGLTVLSQIHEGNFSFSNIYVFIFFIGVVNLSFSMKNWKFATSILHIPTGILGRFKPLWGSIAALVYNLLFGAVVGVVGVAYELTIRAFVMRRKEQFIQLEQEYISAICANPAGEAILMQEGANRLMDRGFQGGNAVLTTQRFVYKKGMLGGKLDPNRKKPTLAVRLDEIVGVQRGKYGPNKNLLDIRTANAKSYRFYVADFDAWERAINRAISILPQTNETEVTS